MDEKDWAIIASISSAVSAIAAFLTVLYASATLKEDKESKRPYFSFRSRDNNNTSPLKQNQLFLRNLENVGVHPACDLTIKCLAFDIDLKSKPLLKDIAIITEVPMKTSIDVTFEFKSDIPNYSYIISHFEYNDPLIERSFTQTLFMKSIMRNTPAFVIKEEFKKIEHYLSKWKYGNILQKKLHKYDTAF